jgi:hypothetical protein
MYKPEDKDSFRMTSVRVHRDVYEQIVGQARHNDRSIAKEIAHRLRQTLQQEQRATA